MRPEGYPPSGRTRRGGGNVKAPSDGSDRAFLAVRNAEGCRVGRWRSDDITLFPAPPHQTVHEVFPHTAFLKTPYRPAKADPP